MLGPEHATRSPFDEALKRGQPAGVDQRLQQGEGEAVEPKEYDLRWGGAGFVPTPPADESDTSSECTHPIPECRTPPLGISCFVIKSTINDPDVTLFDIFAGAFPFAVTMLLVLIVLIMYPPLSLVLL